MLEQEREKNYQNCENRFDEFIYKGAVEEVKYLKEKKFVGFFVRSQFYRVEPIISFILILPMIYRNGHRKGPLE